MGIGVVRLLRNEHRQLALHIPNDRNEASAAVASQFGNVGNGSDAENHSRWKQSFTNDSYKESVNGGSGRGAGIAPPAGF